MVALRLRSYNIFHLSRLVPILPSFDGMFTCPVDESSTYTRVATRSRPKSTKMKGVTVEVGLIAINVYGFILSLKHYERNQLHLEVSRHYRTVLSQFSALEGRELNRERRAGRDKHYNKAGKIKDLRVHFLWSGLHGIIALMGAAVVLHEIVFRQQPSIP